ncbi:hypothetical protein MMC10_002349 [Thelotrema lepadinum]|nr:hypothetical protein [Thelotrema lepadinum]
MSYTVSIVPSVPSNHEDASISKQLTSPEHQGPIIPYKPDEDGVIRLTIELRPVGYREPDAKPTSKKLDSVEDPASAEEPGSALSSPKFTYNACHRKCAFFINPSNWSKVAAKYPKEPEPKMVHGWSSSADGIKRANFDPCFVCKYYDVWFSGEATTTAEAGEALKWCMKVGYAQSLTDQERKEVLGQSNKLSVWESKLRKEFRDG